MERIIIVVIIDTRRRNNNNLKYKGEKNEISILLCTHRYFAACSLFFFFVRMTWRRRTKIEELFNNVAFAVFHSFDIAYIIWITMPLCVIVLPRGPIIAPRSSSYTFQRLSMKQLRGAFNILLGFHSDLKWCKLPVVCFITYTEIIFPHRESVAGFCIFKFGASLPMWMWYYYCYFFFACSLPYSHVSVNYSIYWYYCYQFYSFCSYCPSSFSVRLFFLPLFHAPKSPSLSLSDHIHRRDERQRITFY